MKSEQAEGPVVVGVILAGGLSRRMGGGDKTLMDLDGRPMLARVTEIMEPQVKALALNANGDAERFAQFSLPILPDIVPDFAGPLAGILTGLEWAKRSHPEATHMLSVPADSPFLPNDLAARLAKAVEEGADIACAASGGWNHPVIALWPIRLFGDLHRAVTVDGMRKIDAWTARYRVAAVEWKTEPVDPFFNVNRPEDLEMARDVLARESAGDAAALPDVPNRQTLGVMFHRVPTTHRWGTDRWVPSAVVQGLATDAPMRRVGDDEYVSPGLPLELFAKETDGYRRNLSTGRPRIYVVMRPTEGTPEFAPFHLTACPYEAEAYEQGDEGKIESVDMPDEVAAWVGAFCARNHREQQFIKRKQKAKQGRVDEQFARIPPVVSGSGRGEVS